MLQKFTKHINSNFPFLKGKKILIAISGGLDSVVLTHLFSELNFDISLAHCNFQLRGLASDLDEEFVKNLSQKTSNQIFKTKFDTEEYAKKHQLSTQIAARELRYHWFQEIIQQHRFDFVLTAHHADDNLETFLINLTRGSGLDGFTGIPAINGNIIRPLLPFSRAEILTYAQENHIHWREDTSNASTKYIRNKIRHQVVPALKEINPSLLSSFGKTIQNLKESQQIIEDKIDDISSEVIEPGFSTEFNLDEVERSEVTKFNINAINQLSNPKAYLYQLLNAYNFTEWNDVYNLLSAQSGKQVFSKTHRLLKDRDYLFLSSRSNKNTTETTYLIDENSTEIKTPIHLTFEKVDKKTIQNSQTIYIDEALISYPFVLRKWKNGDYFYPSGMHGTKKLSKYFKDEKLSLLEKQEIWLLCNNNNDIIWILQKRQDNRFLAKNQKNMIKVSYIPNK